MIEIDYDDLDISSTYHEAIRGSRERGSGIPLEPDEPAWHEVTKVVWGGVDITKCLSDKEIRRIEEWLSDKDYDEQGN